jgi:hypothetical protein
MIVQLASRVASKISPEYPGWFLGADNGNSAPVNVSDLVAAPFQWGSALRGKRFFHPLGVVAQGVVERVAPAADGLPIPSSNIVARLSKAAGTPGTLPDFIGLAIRVAPEHAAKPWDILLVSAGSSVLGRAVASRPVTSWTGHAMTTLMPLRYRGRNWWLRAQITDGITGFGFSLDNIRDRIERDGIELALDQACGAADFHRLARLRLSSVVDSRRGQDMSFDPVRNTAPGLELYPGWLAGLRAAAYQRSSAGRDAN